MTDVSSSNSLGERVPKLRFPEFEGEWDSSTMGELGTFTKGASLSKSDITENGTPLILYGELYTTYGDIATTIVRKTDKNVKPECYSILGDVIIPTSGESPEEISTCTCVMQDGVILAGDLNIYRTNDVDGRFLSYEINYIRNREIVKIAQGKSIVHIKADELEKIVIRFPSRTEQSKIIELFSCLDRKIELEKKLIESLKLYKRGLLSKLFPQKGESVPQYRFAGFTDAWEQRKLGDVALYRRGSFPQPYGKPEWYDGEGAMPFVQVADVTDVMNLVDDTKQKISKDAQPMSVYAPKGSVLVTLQGSIGRVAITQYGAFVDRTVLIFEDYKLQIDKIFLAYIIKQKFIEEARKAPGGTIKTITKEALSNFDLLIPSIMEQQKLGDCFAELDNLITLHQRKYNACKKEKLALLQQMFI